MSVTGDRQISFLNLSPMTYSARPSRLVDAVAGRGGNAVSTMRQVAALAGVSAKTVSRVMNNDRYVSEDVRRRVSEAIEQLQDAPNTLARSFRSGRDAAIGIAVPDIADPFFATVTQAVEQVARARQTAVFVTSLGNDPADERGS